MKGNLMQLTIWAIPDDPTNEIVSRLLTKIPGLEVSFIVCPPCVRDLYRMPIVVEESGARHFGFDDIRSWITRELT